MKRTAAVIAALALILPAFLYAGDIELTGMLRSYTGSRFSEADTPVAEQTVDLSLQGWGDKTQILINPYAYVGADGEVDAGVREAYIDLFLPSLDIRVGKQAVVWGEAEGAFITDIVSPQDLRSFILADFREVRMGVAAVKADYYAGAFTFETVWLPRFVPTSQPESDSIWHTDAMPVIPDDQIPDAGLENSEVFGKVSYFGSALNAEVMAGYAWDDLPVLTGSAPTPDVEYERLTVVGGSFSTTLGPLVLRSEAAAYLDRTFTRVELPGTLPTLGTAEHHQLHALGGLDWSMAGIDFSSQYIVQYINDWDESLMADEYDQTVTFRMRDSFLSDTLTLEFFGYFGIDPTDALLRPSVTWSIEDGVELETGAELFIGDDEGSFGQYADNSLAYVSLRWYF
jgi:hypothetical protein